MLSDIISAITNKSGNTAESNDRQCVGMYMLKTIIDCTPLPIDQSLVENTFMIIYKLILSSFDLIILKVS